MITIISVILIGYLAVGLVILGVILLEIKFDKKTRENYDEKIQNLMNQHPYASYEVIEEFMCFSLFKKSLLQWPLVIFNYLKFKLRK